MIATGEGSIGNVAGEPGMGINGGLTQREGPRPEPGAPVNGCDIVIGLDGNIDELMRRAVELGATVSMAAEDSPGLGRLGYLLDPDGNLLGLGHNRRVQENDPSIHGETDAFRKAGRQRNYRDTIMVTTLAPCWYCSGLVRQFGIGTVIVGESVNFQGGIEWLRENGVNVIDLNSEECVQMLAEFIEKNPDLWGEDIGE